MRKYLIFSIIYCLLVFTSCGVNFFSIFNPTNIDQVNDADTLIAMGDDYLDKIDYANAYLAYSKALGINSKKSRAIEGICTSYTFLVFSQNTIAGMIMKMINKETNIMENMPLNLAYSVFAFDSTNLYKIINKEADDVIPYKDVEINLHFIVYNFYYLIAYIADGDNDGDINIDTNDYIIIYPGFIISNRVESLMTDNFPFGILAAAKSFKEKKTGYTNLMSHSSNSLTIVRDSFTSSTVKDAIDAFTNNMNTNIVVINSLFDYIDNINMASNLGLTNASGTPLYYLITNILTNYDVFTDSLFQIGITNGDEITNIIPDFTNFYSDMTNFYGTNL